MQHSNRNSSDVSRPVGIRGLSIAQNSSTLERDSKCVNVCAQTKYNLQT